MDATAAHLVTGGARLREHLVQVPGVHVQDPPSSASGIVTFTVEGLAAADVSRGLAARRVRTVSVPASHAQWDLGDRGVDAVVRASLHVYNDESDLAAFVDGVGEIVATHRSEA
jgi:selenocysteine lyase/cysteine desulfurase